MGLSSSTTKTSTKPVYSAQMEGAANNVSSAYNAAAPGIANSAAQIGGMIPGMIAKYGNDPNVTAARTYDQGVLGGQYLNGSPQLDAIVGQTNNDTRNGAEASLGARGLTGGSDYTGIISRALAQNETNLRYSDYNNQLTRMDGAAGRAGSYGAADAGQLGQIIAAAQAQQAPIQAAAGQASSIGGLLGQYTNGTQTSTPSIGMLIAQMAAKAAQAYAGGG